MRLRLSTILLKHDGLSCFQNLPNLLKLAIDYKYKNTKSEPICFVDQLLYFYLGAVLFTT